MIRLRKFISLRPTDRRLLAEAGIVLATLRLGVCLIPLRRLRALVADAAQLRRRESAVDPSFPRRAAWAVAVASAYVPRTRCLTQALAVQFLLERRGYAPTVRIGIARGEGRRLEGHAWVEEHGEIVFGGRFSAELMLPALQGERRHGE
jgi:Transglutaminase-like superfamily